MKKAVVGVLGIMLLGTSVLPLMSTNVPSEVQAKTKKDSSKKKSDKKSSKKPVKKKETKKKAFKYKYQSYYDNKKPELPSLKKDNKKRFKSNYYSKTKIGLGAKTYRLNNGKIVNTKNILVTASAKQLSVKNLTIKQGVLYYGKAKMTGKIRVVKVSNSKDVRHFWVEKGQVIKYDIGWK